MAVAIAVNQAAQEWISMNFRWWTTVKHKPFSVYAYFLMMVSKKQHIWHIICTCADQMTIGNRMLQNTSNFKHICEQCCCSSGPPPVTYQQPSTSGDRCSIFSIFKATWEKHINANDGLKVLAKNIHRAQQCAAYNHSNMAFDSLSMADSTSAFLPEVSAKRWGWQWNTVKRCQIVKPLQLFGRRFDPDQLVTWNIKILWSRICIDQYLQIPQKIRQCVACKTALENLQRFYPRAAKILWNIWVWWKPMFLPGDAATQHSSAFVFAWFAPTHWNSYDTSNKVHYSTHQKIHNHNSRGLHSSSVMKANSIASDTLWAPIA